jgi:hypothetical protein
MLAERARFTFGHELAEHNVALRVSEDAGIVSATVPAGFLTGWQSGTAFDTAEPHTKKSNIKRQERGAIHGDK